MGIIIKTAATVAATAGLVGVAQVAVATTEPAGEEAERSEASVQTFADMETAIGDSTLRRTDTGVFATYQAGGHEPGHTYTLWYVVFNQPENCSDGACGEDDIFVDGDPVAGVLNEEGIAAADIVVGYAAGTIAGDDGEVYLVGRLDEGVPGYNVLFGDGALLKDAAGAEIHLVTRSHGPAIAGLEDVQLTSFDGGCENFLFPPDVATAEGDCADFAFAVHQP